MRRVTFLPAGFLSRDSALDRTTSSVQNYHGILRRTRARAAKVGPIACPQLWRLRMLATGPTTTRRGSPPSWAAGWRPSSPPYPGRPEPLPLPAPATLLKPASPFAPTPPIDPFPPLDHTRRASPTARSTREPRASGAYAQTVTIGFVATHLASGQASFLPAADCRYRIGRATADMAIKTYSLGSRSGAVAAGSALSVSTAAELTRGIAEDHNRSTPDTPINFYSVVRLFSFFLNQTESANPCSEGCEVALAGFWSNGNPAIAKIGTKPSCKTEVHVYAPKQPGSLIVMVGQRDAKEQIFSAICRAFAETGSNWIERAVSTIAYLCEHEGERTIGGAPSVAVCANDGTLYWPFVELDGKTYLDST
jgi:hypothetical protein